MYVHDKLTYTLSCTLRQLFKLIGQTAKAEEVFRGVNCISKTMHRILTSEHDFVET